MDELKKAWGELSGQSDKFAELTPEEIQENVRSKSSGLMEKLRKNVRKKFYFCLFFMLAFGIGVPFVFPLASQILLLILWAGYLIGSVLLYQEYKALRSEVDMAQDIHQGLLAYYHRIKRVLHYEELIALTLYPVSASGGFFLGIKLVDKEAQIMNNPADWVVLIVMLIVFTLAGNWLAKWMNRKAFGKYLRQLKENIEELESNR